MQLSAVKKTIQLTQKIEDCLLDLVFPKNCLSCKKEGVFLCKDCLKKIEIENLQVCPLCQHSVTESGKICRICRKNHSNLKNILVTSNYQDPLIKNLIHQLKYKFTFELAEPLSKIMIKSANKHNLPIPDLIIPVPLHPLRLRWRGFNQSFLLGKHFGENLIENLTIPIDDKILHRKKNTLSQTNIKNQKKRHLNVQEAFEIDKKFSSLVKGKKILLVDDVCTSGYTLNECASTLSLLKPRSIYAIVIARQK